jgi:hypothetical protein
MRAEPSPVIARHEQSLLPAIAVPWLRRRDFPEVGGNGGGLLTAAARLVEWLCITLDPTRIDRRPAAIVLTIAEVRPFADRGRP